MSRYAYPGYIASAAGLDLVFAACAGTRLNDVYAQLGRGILNLRTKLVTITTGGNDVGLFDLVWGCMNRFAKVGNCEHQWGSKVRAETNSLAPRLVRLYRTIEHLASKARVIVLGYPNPFPASKDVTVNGSTVRVGAKECPASATGAVFRVPLSWLATVWGKDLPFLYSTVQALNMKVAEAARQAGAVYLPMDRPGPLDFRHHTVCIPQNSWFYGFRGQPYPLPETLHPNIAGNAAMAGIVTQYLRQHPLP
jgi:lysophospholipase L1-like esterase